MLAEIGVASLDDLFAAIPEEVRFRGKLDLASGKSEPEMFVHLRALAERNVRITGVALSGR